MCTPSFALPSAKDDKRNTFISIDFFFPLIDILSGKIKFHFKIIQSSWYIFLSHAKSIIKSDFLTNVESKHCYKIMITLA